MATIGLYADRPKQLDPAISFDGALQQVALDRIRRAVLKLDLAALPVRIQALLGFPLELGKAVEHSHVLGHYDWPSEVILAIGDYSRVTLAQYTRKSLPAAAQQRHAEIWDEAEILFRTLRSTYQFTPIEEAT